MKPNPKPRPPARRAALALLRETAHLTRVLLRRRLKSLPVTAAEARTLLYLGANHGASQSALAALLDIQPISLTRQLDRLQAGAYVDRRFDETDRRVRRPCLTAKGKLIVRRILAVYDELDETIAGALSDRDIETLGAAMQRLNAVLVTLR